MCQKSECRDRHERERHPSRAMPPDVTWAPEVVEKIRDAMRVAATPGVWQSDGWLQSRNPTPESVVRAALSASPLPEALTLIERLIARRGTMAESVAWDMAVADAAAFLARVKGD